MCEGDNLTSWLRRNWYSWTVLAAYFLHMKIVSQRIHSRDDAHADTLWTLMRDRIFGGSDPYDQQVESGSKYLTVG